MDVIERIYEGNIVYYYYMDRLVYALKSMA